MQSNTMVAKPSTILSHHPDMRTRCQRKNDPVATFLLHALSNNQHHTEHRKGTGDTPRSPTQRFWPRIIPPAPPTSEHLTRSKPWLVFGRFSPRPTTHGLVRTVFRPPNVFHVASSTTAISSRGRIVAHSSAPDSKRRESQTTRYPDPSTQSTLQLSLTRIASRQPWRAPTEDFGLSFHTPSPPLFLVDRIAWASERGQKEEGSTRFVESDIFFVSLYR